MTDASAMDSLSFLVFSQTPHGRVDIDAWNAHAVRFFSTRIGLAEEARYLGEATPLRAAGLRFVVAPDGRAPGIRSGSARPRHDEDLGLAKAAEERFGFTGLSLLAQRCPTVWRLERTDARDALALRLAAVLASLLLGPIFDPINGQLFGVKTARSKLDSLEPEAQGSPSSRSRSDE